jgi:hypothetical protein
VALGLFLAQVKFLYACVSYLTVSLLHLEIWEFANLGIFASVIQQSDFYVALCLLFGSGSI